MPRGAVDFYFVCLVAPDLIVSGDMGASCSSSAATKYRHVRDYLTSKPCMTFDMVQTFVPLGDRPPVVLLGESHDLNESDSVTARCVTVFTALVRIVSDCRNPASKVFFVMEAPIPDAGVLPPAEDLQGGKSLLNPEGRFSVSDAWMKDFAHSRRYLDGLSVIPFDMFYETRSLFVPAQGYRTTKERAFARTRQGIEYVFREMGVDMVATLPAVFARVDATTEQDTESYRSRVTAVFDRHNEEVLAQSRRRMRLRQDNISYNAGRPPAEHRPVETEEEISRSTVIHHFWMFQLVYWCGVFVLAVMDAQPSWTNSDVEAMNIHVSELEKVVERPHTIPMFEFVSKCGDVATYFAFLRARLNARNTNSVFVLYGGSMHMQHFAELIWNSGSYTRDLVRVTDVFCGRRPRLYFADALCREKDQTKKSRDAFVRDAL